MVFESKVTGRDNLLSAHESYHESVQLLLTRIVGNVS